MQNRPSEAERNGVAEFVDVHGPIMTGVQPVSICLLEFGGRSAGLRAESCFRAHVLTTHRSELALIGHLSTPDWESVRARVRIAFAL